MNKLFFGSVATLFVAILLSSCARVNLKDGLQAYEELRYHDAINNLSKGLEKIDDQEGRIALANAYAQVNDYEKAAQMFEVASLSPNFTDEDRIQHGRVLMSVGKYDEAATLFSGILSRDPGNQEVHALRNSCSKIEELKRDSSRYEVTPLFTGELNSAYAPHLKDGRVYFSGTSARAFEKDPYTGVSYTDLYSAPLEGVNFGKAEKVKGVNGNYHDGIASISPDGSLMVLTRSNYDGKNSLGSDADHINMTQLYMASRKEDGSWDTPTLLPFCNEAYMYAHPVWSPDGNSLIFSSDREGSYGGMDLFKVNREGGIWGQPENLGGVINTTGNELFPSFRSADTLYFSSNSHQTLGGQDILYSVKRNGDWTSPTHLPYPMNTPWDDFGVAFTGDGSTGYFSSDRSGKDQIYYFVANEASFSIDGFVSRKFNDSPIANAKVTITNLTDGIEEVYYTDELGMFETELSPGKNYKVRVEKDGFFAVNESINTSDDPDGKVYKLNLSLLDISNPEGGDGAEGELTDGTGNGDGNIDGSSSNGLPKGVSANQPYKVPNILWDYDDWEVREDAKPYLNYVSKLLKDNPDLNIEIRSHCDSRGSDLYNDRLSEKRAKAVTEYLVKKGVKRSMLVSRGYGKRELLNRCVTGVECSDEEHQANRRTEFRVLD